MTRPSSEPTGQVRPDKPAPVARSADLLATGAPAAPRPQAPSADLSLGWRVALLLWASAFTLLLLFELLQFAVKIIRKLF